ncbi:Putative protein CrcB homolog 1 [Mycobacteroides abscessus subsp. abscessus]|nr:Putative protein CrcB homolog 1 [Mycobacteroides abscessus subsp. abscessus]
MFLGGGLGASIRWLLTLGLPFTVIQMTWAINVLGAFCLGFLLAFLTGLGAEQGGRKIARLFLGTGFMGGFTTYSALSVQSVGLLSENPQIFWFYSGTTLLLGLLVCLLGTRLGSAAARRRGVSLATKKVGEGL